MLGTVVALGLLVAAVNILAPNRSILTRINMESEKKYDAEENQKIDEMGELLNNEIGKSDGRKYSNGLTEDWCGNFLNWAKYQLGYTDEDIPNCRSCKLGAEGFEAKKRWYDRGSCIPKRGYYVFFRWNPSSISYDHVGWVEKVYQEGNTTKILVISGNTPNVSKTSYDINDSRIIGYGAPNYGKDLDLKTEINTKNTGGELALDFTQDEYKYILYKTSQDERDI